MGDREASLMMWSIFSAMRRAMWCALAVTSLAGCQRAPHAATDTRRTDSLDLGAGLAPRDSADSALLAPRVFTGPTVLVFWLTASALFPPDDQTQSTAVITSLNGP